MSAVSIQLVQTTVHGRVLVRPARGVGRARGLLVGFHGYAEDAGIQLRRLEGVAGAGDWTLISVQGLNRFYRGRREEVVASWMTRQDREAAIEDNIGYVNRVLETIDQAARSPIVYAGFSQGVAMAFRAALGARFEAAGVIAVGGDVPPELLARGPDAGVPIRPFPPVLLARGQRDDWYTQAKLDSDTRRLLTLGTRVTPLVFDASHEWTAAVDRAAGEFLARVVDDR